MQDNEKGRYKADKSVEQLIVDNFLKQLTYESNKEFTFEEPILNLDYKNIRINAIHHSLSPYGTTASFRRSLPELKLKGKVDKLAPKKIFDLLDACIKSKCNILISGKTGSGKTELQKFLVQYIEDSEKIILIEDVLDTHLKEIYPEKDIFNWKVNESIDKPIDFEELIKAGLRNNPTWILISEVRGAESYQMIKSGLSGHNIITTLHSINASSNIERLIHLCKEKYNLDQVLLGKIIADVFDIGIHLDYETSNGIERFIVEIVEYESYSEKGTKVNTLFKKEIKVNKVGKEYVYSPTYFYGKISRKLFNKLVNSKSLMEEIQDFVKEEYLNDEETAK